MRFTYKKHINLPQKFNYQRRCEWCNEKFTTNKEKMIICNDCSKISRRK